MACLNVKAQLRPSVCPSICSSVCTSVCPFYVCSSVRLFVCSSVRLSVRLSVRPIVDNYAATLDIAVETSDKAVCLVR